MSNQIPAVLSNAWAFPEMVTPGVNGELVKTGDVDDMAEKIIALLDDPARLEAMGLAARTMVQGRFTWEAVVKKMRRRLSV
jgi:glycosyltransferase involved in cell wall biosynthesis